MWRISEPFDLIWWESRIFRTCLRTNFQAIWPRYHFPSNIIYFTIGLAMLFIEKWYRATVNCWLIWISVKYNFCYLTLFQLGFVGDKSYPCLVGIGLSPGPLLQSLYSKIYLILGLVISIMVSNILGSILLFQLFVKSFDSFANSSILPPTK